EVYSAKSPEDKRMQRALMQYWLPKNQAIVRKALTIAGRQDLIGYDKKCLVRPAGDKFDRSKADPSNLPRKKENRAKNKVIKKVRR
ncbi:MAG: DUF3362 domain-containing protein, partial [Selenomonas sp.]|nr:DUF3362 domain-containing protein [Selenomonas sp.]